MFHRQDSGGVQEAGTTGGIIGGNGSTTHSTDGDGDGEGVNCGAGCHVAQEPGTGIGGSLGAGSGEATLILAGSSIVGMSVSGTFSLTRGCVTG